MFIVAMALGSGCSDKDGICGLGLAANSRKQPLGLDQVTLKGEHWGPATLQQLQCALEDAQTLGIDSERNKICRTA